MLIQMYGTDKTAIENLTNTVNELESLKIEVIEPQPKNTNKINESIQQMQNQLIQVDEKIVKEFIENKKQVNNIEQGQEVDINEKQEQEITFSEDSNINILISNIEVLIKEVNDDVKIEADRKAEEEKKAKEEAEKAAMDKILTGDFSYFAGTYVEFLYGSGQILVISKDGSATISMAGDNSFTTNFAKPISVTKQKDGTYFCSTGKVQNYAGEYVTEEGFTIYPVGVKGEGNINKIRIARLGGYSIDGIFEKK